MRIAALSKVVIIGVVSAGVLTPAAAGADDPRPILQMPFPCNEVRQGASYAGHGGEGNHFPLDFNRGSGDDDLGDPVLAAGPGRVQTWVEADGDTVVRIVHNATWASEVHHLMAGSVTVSNGDHVEQGDRIGRVGKTGTRLAHLHYAQLRNGVAAQLFFDGAPLSPDYVFFDEANGTNGPDYRSRNCSNADMSVSGVAGSDGSLTVFARRSGDNMWTKVRRADGTWSDWANRGGNLASGPDAALTAAGHHHVVAKGANGKVHYKRQTALGWGDWQNTFSDFDTPYAPAIVQLDGNNLMALAVRAVDRALMKRHFAGGAWGAWTRVGDAQGWTSGPDASLRDGGRVDVVIRGAGGKVNHVVRNADGTWSAFRAMGDLTSAVGVAPAVASRQADTVDILARGENGFVHRNTWTAGSGWSDWNPIRIGQLNHGPDLVAGTRAGELLLLGRDTDAHIVRSVWNPGQGWSDPAPIPAG